MRYLGLDQQRRFAGDVCLGTVLLVNPGELAGVCLMWRAVRFVSVSVSLGVVDVLFDVEGVDTCILAIQEAD